MPLYTLIFDPKKDWKDNNPTWQALLAAKQVKKSQVEARKQNKHDDREEIQFIIDTTGDPTLQQNFLPFQLDNESSKSW